MKKHKTEIYYTNSMSVFWLNCPYCKRMIMIGQKSDMETLKKWKQQK